MCGLVTKINLKKKKVNEDCINQFENQKDRGTMGFGVVVVDKQGKVKVDKATESAKFMFDLHAIKTHIMMIHHRIPTGTLNKLSQAHPISVDHQDFKFKYLVIHNGVINNTLDLFEKHLKENFAYSSQDENLDTARNWNDSESLAIEVAKAIENKSKEYYTIRAEGSAAFIAMQVDKKTNKPIALYWGRNKGNPLNIKFNKDELFLSSEGEGEEVEPFKLNWCSLTTDKIKIKNKDILFKIPTYVPLPVQTYYNPNTFSYRNKPIKNKLNSSLAITNSNYHKYEDWPKDDEPEAMEGWYPKNDVFEDYMETMRETLVEEITQLSEEFGLYYSPLDVEIIQKKNISETCKKIANLLQEFTYLSNDQWTGEIFAEDEPIVEIKKAEEEKINPYANKRQATIPNVLSH